MRIDSLTPPVALQPAGENSINSPDQGFKQILDKAVAAKEDKQLKEAAKQFEALFIYQMYSQMRESIDKGGLLDGGLANNIFQGLLDQEVSIKAAETGSFGLADQIYKQLKTR